MSPTNIKIIMEDWRIQIMNKYKLFSPLHCNRFQFKRLKLSILMKDIHIFMTLNYCKFFLSLSSCVTWFIIFSFQSSTTIPIEFI